MNLKRIKLYIDHFRIWMGNQLRTLYAEFIGSVPIIEWSEIEKERRRENLAHNLGYENYKDLLYEIPHVDEKRFHNIQHQDLFYELYVDDDFWIANEIRLTRIEFETELNVFLERLDSQ